MKNWLLLGLLLLLIPYSSIGQVTDSSKTENENTSDDSLTVTLPAKAEANLSLIIPPDGFEPTDKFNGYIHYEASSGIIMTLIENANYIKISEGMTDDFFRKNGLTFIEKKSFVSDNGVKGIYYKSSFVTSNVDFIRYMVYAGDLNKTLWLNITYPTKLEELIESDILTTIQSIQLNIKGDEK